MSAELFIYLAYVINSIGHALFLAGCISFLIAVFFSMKSVTEDDKKDAEDAAAKAKKIRIDYRHIGACSVILTSRAHVVHDCWGASRQRSYPV